MLLTINSITLVISSSGSGSVSHYTKHVDGVAVHRTELGAYLDDSGIHKEGLSVSRHNSFVLA